MSRIAALFCMMAPLVFADGPPITMVATAPAIQSVTVRGTHRYVDLATQVGQPYNADVIDSDVHKLWDTGRFEDIRVETIPKVDGTAVVFRVIESPELPLHRLRIDPSTFGLQLPLREGTPLNRVRAQAAAIEARKQLEGQGYLHAEVDYRLVPVAHNQVDLHLTVTPGGRLRVKEIDFTGDVVFDAKELRTALRAMRTRRVFGWPMFPTYSPEAVEADVARLRSWYLSKGYFDAKVLLDDLQLDRKEARVQFRIEPGPLYQVKDEGSANLPALCPSMLAARRQAERQGILDFSATLTVQPSGLTVATQSGQPFRVGRIDFIGNRHYSDATLRRNFLLDEGQLFDERLLRLSLAKLNRTMLFEPVSEVNAAIHTNEASGVADVTVRLIERKRGAWNLSGPVGPASFAGPLQASLSSRLPPWGSGLLELSTYTASVSMFAFAHPLLPLLAVDPRRRLWPVLALQRPFSPAEGWKSGFSFAPQLGWRVSGLNYSITQAQQRLLPLLSGDRGLTPELQVAVQGPGGDGVIFCEPPTPRFEHARIAAAVGLRVLGALAAF
jgi:hypothetical protein